ncbi:F-box protein At3g07870-like [Henckelia pumila]|uniref:F-box protein At3g07870-like n=1 Tax=Henckelia pumila TaxID=405737 RepID=UPI003C6E7EA4
MVRKRKSGAVLAVADEPMSSNPYICHSCKRCARKRKTRYLPQDIVFQFLSRLPAQLLHDVVRHVCREWSLVIRSPNFIHHHLRNSTGGLIVQDQHSPRNGFYVEMRRGCLEICNFDCGFDGLVWSSCNGLVVFSALNNFNTLYVSNPLTKTNLPPYRTRKGDYSALGIALVEASMKYKVVHARGKYFFPNQIAVLTIGLDKVWRHINVKHLLLPNESLVICWPLVTGGYVHWMSEYIVLTLNVETEIVRRFPVPPIPNVRGKYLAMDSHLSFVYNSDECHMDVWQMNSITGEWTLLLSFDSKPLIHTFKGMFPEFSNSVRPLCWLVARKVLVFSDDLDRRCWIAYDVKASLVQLFEFNEDESYHFRAHVNSLVWLK